MKEVASIIADLKGSDIASLLDGKDHLITYSNGEIAISKDEIIVQRTDEGVKVLNEVH
jgi:isoleucyl-tRNA synthetase